MKVIGVIPSRYASTRLPGKPLANIAGKPLVQWVWEAAGRVALLDEVLVATDARRREVYWARYRPGTGPGAQEPSSKPFQLDRCHALEHTTETVRRYYPKWYRGAVDAGTAR